VDIIGNHVALVRKGRAGARCVIMDSDKREDKLMTWKDKFRKLFNKTLDEMKEEDLKDLEKKGDEGLGGRREGLNA
jgi:hypothetical protein